MTVEATYGVPTVAMHTDKFDTVVRQVAAHNGMPGLRQVFVPQPIMGKTAAQLRAYVDGTDPISGRPVMQEVIEGLTQPFDEKDLGAIEFDRSTPRLVEPDTEENLHRLFLENRWTDMLPIVLPTEERVAAMLAATRRKPGEVVARMRSTHFREYWEYTVEKVAVNAVMAGARPDYFPVILALRATGLTASCPRTARAARCPGRGTWATRAIATPTTASPSPRTRSGAPGSPFTSSTASSRPTAPSASSAAAARRPSRSGCARRTGASTCATCSAGWTRTRRRRFCSIPSPRASSSSAAGSRRRTR